MDEDVSKLTDEELDARIAGEEPASPEPAEEAPKEEESTAVEQDTQETPEESEAPAEEQPEEDKAQEEVTNEEPEEKPPSRREQLRIQQLLKKYGPPPEQPQVAPSQQEAINYQEALDADPEVIKQLEADRQAYAEAQYRAGADSTRAEIRTSEWRTTLNFDAPQTEAKYPWLNPKDTANFDPAMADAVNEEYKSLVGYNEQTGLVERPDIRYSDFVEARVELSTRLAKAMTADTTKNIAKQAATTGLRPDGSSAKRMNLNKPAHQMTDEELEAKLAQSGFGTK